MLGAFFYDIFIAKENGEIKSIDEALKILAPKGVEYVDTDLSLFSRYDIGEYIKTLSENDVKTKSSYCLFPFDFTVENIVGSYKDEIKRQLELCKQIDSEMYMPVPRIDAVHKNKSERDECLKAVTECLNMIADLSEEYDIKPVLENFSNINVPYSYISDLQYILSQVPKIKYVLDSGNYWFGGDDPVKACEILKDYIVHVHFKDWLPNEQGFVSVNGKTCDGVALGDGILPIKKLSEMLDSYGYTGGRTVETNDHCDIMKKIQKSLMFLKS